MLDKGLDLYREICCALGTEATAEHHRASCVASGSSWSAEQLARAYAALSQVPFSAQVLPQCEFLHFGTTRQLITSGLELLKHDDQPAGPGTCLSLNNRLTADGRILGGDSWVEGCRLAAPLRLAGQNVVVGVDVEVPLELPAGACLDVIAGETRAGREALVRPRISHRRHVQRHARSRRHARRPAVGQWLAAVGAKAEDVWAADIPPASGACGTRGSFPPSTRRKAIAIGSGCSIRPRPPRRRKQAFLRADRYSVAEIALLADMDAFYKRRTNIPCDTH